jgi:hypothetical protein
VKVFCQTVVRNEAGRYWDSWLNWHGLIFGPENIHVFDDNSTDDTAQMAVDAGMQVTARGGGPAFLEHEGQFRQRAWNVMEVMLEPAAGDWVFCIDADEFLLARGDEAEELYRACEWGNQQGRGAYLVSIPEVFQTELSDGKLVNPQVRVDRWWGRIAGTRLFAWQPGGVFADRAMASGSEPTYVPAAPRTTLQNMWLLHFGYARPEDVKAKYERYTARPGGHADSHVQSIMAEPDLVPWDGPLIDVYLGPRPTPGPQLFAGELYAGQRFGMPDPWED